VDRLVHLTQLVADRKTQRELRLEVVLRGAYTRVLADLEHRLVALSRGFQTDAVLARRTNRPREGGLGGLPRRVVLHSGRVRVAHVPEEPVETGLFRHLWLARLLDLLGTLLLWGEWLFSRGLLR